MDIIAPLAAVYHFGAETGLVIAFGLGFFFGFALERAGFGSARILTAQFYFYDMRVFKVMFTAVVTAMTLLGVTSAMGLLDFSMLLVNTTQLWPQIVGGLLLGVGFCVGGYCPGTSMVALAVGRVDAWIYVAGFLFGLFLFPVAFDSLADFYNSGNMGRLVIHEMLGMSLLPFALIVLVIAIGSFIGASKVEKWAREKWGYRAFR